MSVRIQVTQTGGNKFRAKMNQIMATPFLAGYDVGWAAGEQYVSKGSTISVSNVAKIQQFGAPSAEIAAPRRGVIPPRPFFTYANDEFHKTMLMMIPKLAGFWGYISVRNVHTLANEHVSEVKRQIIALQDPANSPATAKRKANGNDPLIETRKMLEATDYDTVKRI